MPSASRPIVSSARRPARSRVRSLSSADCSSRPGAGPPRSPAPPATRCSASPSRPATHRRRWPGAASSPPPQPPVSSQNWPNAVGPPPASPSDCASAPHDRCHPRRPVRPHQHRHRPAHQAPARSSAGHRSCCGRRAARRRRPRTHLGRAPRGPRATPRLARPAPGTRTARRRIRGVGACRMRSTAQPSGVSTRVRRHGSRERCTA